MHNRLVRNSTPHLNQQTSLSASKKLRCQSSTGSRVQSMAENEPTLCSHIRRRANFTTCRCFLGLSPAKVKARRNLSSYHDWSTMSFSLEKMGSAWLGSGGLLVVSCLCASLDFQGVSEGGLFFLTAAGLVEGLTASALDFLSLGVSSPFLVRRQLKSRWEKRTHPQTKGLIYSTFHVRTLTPVWMICESPFAPSAKSSLPEACQSPLGHLSSR